MKTTTTTKAPPRRSAAASGDHWKRLLRRPGEPLPMTVEDAVDELNRRLRADPSWRDDTRFVVAPPAADGSHPGGPTWEGPDAMKPVVLRVAASLVGDYAVERPFFSDR